MVSYSLMASKESQGAQSATVKMPNIKTTSSTGIYHEYFNNRDGEGKDAKRKKISKGGLGNFIKT